jgi:hypothetical protein
MVEQAMRMNYLFWDQSQNRLLKIIKNSRQMHHDQ